MEDLLTPQICMDIDETPLDVGRDDTSNDSSSESGEPEMGEDGKVKMLLEEKFTDSSQVPAELTDFEKDAKKNVFAIGEPAVQFHRLHCTACNIHLGSAPIGHFNRYIHPLLKVLLCKSCYEFYCSGEFDKDEDGSEMYCRWCGQGGKVMCCAQCAYVFCQKCVRQNLGKRTLELIKDSDDWLCFGCNPTQLINLKIICTSLFDFVQEEIRLSKSLNNIERLKVDHSVCCQKTKAAKRKREEDATYIPNEWEEQNKPKKPSILKNTLTKPLVMEENNEAKAKNWTQKDEAEVVCTPDLMALMEDDPPPLAPMPKSVQLNKPSSANAPLNKQINKSQLNSKEQTPIIKAIRTDGKKLYTLAPKTMMICNTNNVQRPPSGFIRLQTPAIKFVPSLNRSTPILNSIPSQIVPGTKHEWYDKAATVVSTITGSLSTTLINLTKEQRNAKTVEQLANIHNKLQELLSSSVNSLIQVRKNLRAEFLDDLNKLKFPNSNLNRNTNISTVTKSKVNHSANKEHDEDDDVIIVNSESTSTKTLMEPPPLVKISSDPKSTARPYLKVRSVSQLLAVSSECITIPDDPPGSIAETDDVIAVEEKDPLELSPSTSNQFTCNENLTDRESIIRKNVSEYDADTIKIKNALTESRIDQMITDCMKYKVDISEEELKRILSVRVLISTNFGKDLPENRLKTADDFVDDSEINLIGNKENEDEDPAVEIENVDSPVNNDNTKYPEKIEEHGRKNVTNSLDNENNPDTDQMEIKEIESAHKESNLEVSEKVDNNNDTILENEEKENCSKELDKDNDKNTSNDSTRDSNDDSPKNDKTLPENEEFSPENNDPLADKNVSSAENNDILPESERNDSPLGTNDFHHETNNSSPENNDSPHEHNGSSPENNDSSPENNDSCQENNDSSPENNGSSPENNESSHENDDCLSENEALSNDVDEESNIMEENGLDSPNETRNSEKIIDCNESSALSSHSESSVNKNKNCLSGSENIAMDSCTGDDSK